MLRNFPPDRNPASAPCPKCSTPGSLRPHGGYDRWLQLEESDPMALVRVERMRCSECGSTHAVLPEGVVPYKALGARVMAAICVAKKSGAKVEDVCSKFGVSARTLYRILGELPRVLSMLGSLRPGAGIGLLLELPEGAAALASFVSRFARTPFEKVALPQSTAARGDPT